MKKVFLVSLLSFPSAFCLLTSALAQGNSPLGSRSSGLGNASVSLSDLWSVQNNQAGLGFVKEINAGIYYQNQFMLKELGTKVFGCAVPTKHGTLGVCISNFGYSLFNQSKYALAFGKSFGNKLSAGVMMDYLQTNLSEYGKKGTLAAEAGIQAKPIKNLTIGMHIFNLTGTRLADYNDEHIPTTLRLGADYKFSDKVFVALETEKDIEKKAMLKTGLEYKLVKELSLRAGISTNPSLSCFGIGINLKKLQLDLSSTFHSTFGFSPQMGLIYQFDSASKKQTK